MENQGKKKTNVFLYTIVMLLIFLFITEFVIYGYGGELLYLAISKYPQGSLVISEAILATMVLVVMLLFKNSYVFTQKNEPIKTGLFYGLFYIIGIVLFTLMYGVLLGGFSNGLALINVLIGALLVGVCEEFLCRGWLLNEFLERFGHTKKGAWYAIIISGLIFGLIHLGNFFNGQNLVSTITQILNASATGFAFGLIYYKTKNIWSVIILHGLWDFSLFLGDIAPITEATEIFNGFSAPGLIFTVLMILAELLILVPHIKDIDAKPNSGAVVYCSILGFFFFFVFLIVSSLFSSKTGETYEYAELKLENYAVTRDNYDAYKFDHVIKNVHWDVLETGETVEKIVEEKYNFELSYNKDGNVILTNMNTKNNVEIECEDLVDLIVLEEDEYFILAYEDYVDMSNTYLYYVYLNKNELSNSDEYLNEVKKNFKKYLLPERLELIVVNDSEKDKDYIGAYDVDYGYFLLTKENEMAVLNG